VKPGALTSRSSFFVSAALSAALMLDVNPT
jgi:hypothetical protein